MTIKFFGLLFIVLSIGVFLILGSQPTQEKISSFFAGMGRLFVKIIDINTGDKVQWQDAIKDFKIGSSPKLNTGPGQIVGAQPENNAGLATVLIKNDKNETEQAPKNEAELEKLKKELGQKALLEKQIKQESVAKEAMIQKTAEQQYQEKLQAQLAQQRLLEEQKKQQEAGAQKNLKTAIEDLKRFFGQRLNDYNARLNALDNQLASKESEINLINQEYYKKIEIIRSQAIPVSLIIEQENQLAQEKNNKLEPLQSELKFLKDQRDKLKETLVIPEIYIYSVDGIEWKFMPSINGDGGYLIDSSGNYYRVIYYLSGSFIVSLP